MIEDLGHGGHELGYYAGGLAASFCGAQFCSSVLWGIISDKYGRKPAVVLGTMGTAAGMLIFGTAKTYPQAVLGRVVGGLLSGNLGVLKSFLSEITDETNQGKGFSYISVAWSLGCLMAPLAGGLLCSPADKYPAIFSKNGLFGYYPYLLPCLLCVIFNLASATMCAVVMKETRKWAPAANNNNNITTLSASSTQGLELVNVTNTSKNRILSLVSGWGSAKGKGKGSYEPLSEFSTHGNQASTSPVSTSAQFSILNSDGEDDEEEEDEDAETDEELASIIADNNNNNSNSPVHTTTTNNSDDIEANIHNSSRPSKTFSKHKRSKYMQAEEQKEQQPEPQSSDSAMVEDFEEGEEHICTYISSSSSSLPLLFICCRCLSQSSTSNNNNSSSSGVSGSDSDKITRFSMLSPSSDFVDFIDIPTYGQLQKGEAAPVLRQRSVVLSTICYGILAMAYILFDETIPLFLKLDKTQGGFQFDSAQIGLLLSVSGGAMLGFNFYILPTLSQWPKKILFQRGNYGAIPLILFWPCLALLNQHVLLHWKSHTAYVAVLWPTLLLMSLFKNVFACLSFTAVMLQINHSVTNELLGKVNGMGQSLASAARAIGPALGGMLWSISIQRQFVFLNFIAVMVILAASSMVNHWLPMSIDRKRRSRSRTGVLSGGKDEEESVGDMEPIIH